MFWTRYCRILSSSFRTLLFNILTLPTSHLTLLTNDNTTSLENLQTIIIDPHESLLLDSEPPPLTHLTLPRSNDQQLPDHPLSRQIYILIHIQFPSLSQTGHNRPPRRPSPPIDHIRRMIDKQNSRSWHLGQPTQPINNLRLFLTFKKNIVLDIMVFQTTSHKMMNRIDN